MRAYVLGGTANGGRAIEFGVGDVIEEGGCRFLDVGPAAPLAPVAGYVHAEPERLKLGTVWFSTGEANWPDRRNYMFATLRPLADEWLSVKAAAELGERMRANLRRAWDFRDQAFLSCWVEAGAWPW